MKRFFSSQCFPKKDRSRESRVWLHLFCINTFWICEMIICLLSVTQDTAKTTGCLSLKAPQLANAFVCSGWQQVHLGNCPSPAQKKEWLPKCSDSGGYVLCKWAHRRQLSTDVAQPVCNRKRRIFFCCCWQDFHIQLHFSTREANKNKCVTIYHIHK